MSDDDAFGAELVEEQDDGTRSNSSQQATPRAQNIAPQSFSYSNVAQQQQQNSASSSNNNIKLGGGNYNDITSGASSSSGGRINTAEPNGSLSGTRRSPRTRGEGHFSNLTDQPSNSEFKPAVPVNNNNNGQNLAASNNGFGIHTSSTRDTFQNSMMNSTMMNSTGNNLTANPSRVVPGQHPGMYLSFSSIPGRRSVNQGGGGAVSNVSAYFKDDEDNDGDDGSRQPSPAFNQGGAAQAAPRVLPAPEFDVEEAEEELQTELLRCVTEQMTSCNLSRLQIQRIPQEVRCFSWLRELLIGENNIALLPDTIFLQMQQLEVLDLMENKLVTVPRSVFQLRNLKKCLLDHNKIADLPDDIDPDPIEQFGLPELVEVGLEWNALRRFPINFLSYAPKLERLFLSENPGISHLPPPKMIEDRTKKMKIRIRLDNRPMLLQAAAANKCYSPSAGYVQLEWNKIYPDRVLDYLYLGSMRTAQCVEVYQDLDIGYVLTAARNLDVVLGPGMKHLTLPFDDLPGEDISHFFELSFKFIDEAVANKKGILIHCFAGLSRSVAMTMGYLMKKYNVTADDALNLVKQSRPPAHPNDGFVQRLRQYTKELGIDPEDSKVNLSDLSAKNAKNSAQASATTGAAITAAKEEEEKNKQR